MVRGGGTKALPVKEAATCLASSIDIAFWPPVWQADERATREINGRSLIERTGRATARILKPPRCLVIGWRR
ncbi:MAG: hypothetical protein A3I03_05580 [Candidatus Rokubacteria bacterium RIFCSPLOWO2_02_FULL_68_19]|nr:MAG: hypothetical protein A3I03_05580 [Candidatus Rokubacteria bacterium RIFCSPLOWO2_02_FULL_68_19]